MQNEYVKAFIYIALGLVGLCCHWAKKLLKDKTTKCTLKEYLVGDIGSTMASVSSIVLAEITLSTAQIGDYIAIGELVGAITAGFSLDSITNVAPDKLIIEVENVLASVEAGIDPGKPP